MMVLPSVYGGILFGQKVICPAQYPLGGSDPLGISRPSGGRGGGLRARAEARAPAPGLRREGATKERTSDEGADERRGRRQGSRARGGERGE